jgi:hypothetical protein
LFRRPHRHPCASFVDVPNADPAADVLTGPAAVDRRSARLGRSSREPEVRSVHLDAPTTRRRLGVAKISRSHTGPLGRRGGFPLVIASVGLCLGLSACHRQVDASDRQSTAQTSDSSVAVESQITGRERFGWTQRPSGSPARGPLRFVAYVDGRRVDLPGVTCSPSKTSSASECSAPLPEMSPGRHILEVAAIDSTTNVESQRSIRITLTVVSAAELPAVRARATDAKPRELCTTEPKPTCYSVEVLAEGLVSPRHLVAIPDGRLLFSEGEARLVIVDANGPRDAYTLPDRVANQVQIHAIAVDPDFTRTRAVYVAVTRSRARSQRRTISVVRMREESGALFESAIVVRELPMAIGEAALAVGADQAVYLAMDNGAGRVGVARFDGARETRRGGSDRAVVATDVTLPARLLVDRNQLWIGRLGAQSPTLRVISVGGAQQRSGVPVIVRLDGWPATSQLRDMAIATSSAAASRTLFLALDGQPALFRATLAGTDATTATLQRVPLEMTPVAVAASADGEAYVLARPMNAPTAAIRLLRLGPL